MTEAERKRIVNEMINETLQEWGVEVINVLEQRLRKRKLILTGDLLQSLKFDVLEATAEATGHLKLLFRDSGRIRDMRAPHWKKMPPIKEMEEFVKKIGVSKFRRVPGYNKPGKFPTQDIAIRRIAWGIAKHRLKTSKTKPKKWFARPFYGMVNVLIDKLIDGYSEIASKTITEEIKNGIS